MKKILLHTIITTITILPLSSLAQNSIYKCSDNQGHISYVNNTNRSNAKCIKTQLGDSSLYSIAPLSKNKGLENNNKHNENNTSSNIRNEFSNQNVSQELRDNKRDVILKKELENENEQLLTISNMLSKSSPNDMAQLKEMQQIHQRNILALEKELGMSQTANKNTTNLTSINNTIDKNNIKNISVNNQGKKI